MTTRPKTTRRYLPSEPPSAGIFQVVVEPCVYTASSNRFLPARTLERKARLRPATLYKAQRPSSAPGRRQRVA
ncbi:MAG TPA: hypothetical protein VI197_27105 [Polyangiaceae bacterium]